MTNLPKNNYEVCGRKLYNKEVRCNVIASHWTGDGTLLCIRADGAVETKYKVRTYETTEDNLELGWKSRNEIRTLKEKEYE